MRSCKKCNSTAIVRDGLCYTHFRERDNEYYRKRNEGRIPKIPKRALVRAHAPYKLGPGWDNILPRRVTEDDILTSTWNTLP